MARKIKQHREYRFEIEAYSPETIPMSRLAEYLTDLAIILGNEKSVHFLRLEKGSTVPVFMVEYEAEPKVRERIRQIKHKDAPERSLEAMTRLDKRLAEDNGRGNLVDPSGAKVLKFPGRDRLAVPVFGPINQTGVLQGVPIKIGGENDPVPIHLEDGKSKYIVHAKRALAKEIADYLFTDVVRIEGTGRWVRNAESEWEMLTFTAHSVARVEDANIRKNVSSLRKIDADWKHMDDPLTALERIRGGGKVQ
jgi:hypothetical protein